MPNIDGGHYFLTVLAPVRVDFIADKDSKRSHSHRHLLAEELALLDTGRQTLASPLDDPPSPFAANTMNHFVRFAIIDGPPYNGRVSRDTIYNLVKSIDPLIAQPVDRLSKPYLLFSADFDAKGGEANSLRAYATTLWGTLDTDGLIKIFRHCEGFDNVNSAETFYAYLVKCQVETTMPFNDYWLDGLPVETAKPPIAPLIGSAIVVGALLVAFVVKSEFGSWVERLVGRGLGLSAIVLCGVALAAYLAYVLILRRGGTPFPSAEGCDLPSVLKSLYLQQHFTRFAIEAQGLSATQLHARFGAFLAAVKPADPNEPTQDPGEVTAPDVEWAR